MTRLRDIDSHQNGRVLCDTGLGHSRSPLQCGSCKNHCRDLRHGYDHPLRYTKTTQVLKASKPSSQCHSEGVMCLSSLPKVRDWVTAVGAKTAYIEPESPSQNGCCECFNARLRDEVLNGEISYSLRDAQIQIER